VVVRLLRDHLWRHILKCATKSIPLCIHLLLDTPAEITNLEHIFISNKQILGLQIPMDKAINVQEVNSSDRLDEKVKCLIFS